MFNCIGFGGLALDRISNLLDEVLEIDSVLKTDPAIEALFNYNNTGLVHKKQMEFHKCLKRNRWVFGGNRSGKSECGAVEVVWLARGIHPYRQNKPVDGWIVSLSFGVQKAVTQKKIFKFLPKDWIAEVVMREGKKASYETGVVDSVLIKNVFGGTSSITFKSIEEGREKFQGASLDFVWFDEEPPEDIWQECVMRVLDKKGDIFATMTPLKGLTFVYDKIYLNPNQDPENFCIFMTWEDNPFLPKSELCRLETNLSGEELERRKFGRFVEKDAGLVYKEFDPMVHIIQPFLVPADWQAGISIDPGLNNPLSCHFYAIDFDGNIYVVAEHYLAGFGVDVHAKAILEIARQLNWRAGRSGKIEALIDSAASQRTLASERSVAELFFENDIAVSCKVNKDVFSGISRVKNLLKGENGKPRLFVFENCVNMIREFKSYMWGNGDMPVKKNDHAMDELRYFVMSRPEIPTMPKQRLSDVALEKRRLIRAHKFRK